MEERKLTKEDIDRVRDIEGFPIAKDEDIIALSRPPYYTACPNPFIGDFIREHGTPYDEETDDYHREPFAVLRAQSGLLRRVVLWRRESLPRDVSQLCDGVMKCSTLNRQSSMLRHPASRYPWRRRFLLASDGHRHPVSYQEC